MSTKSIRTTHEHDVCDVCERTLLRGEYPEVFVNGGRRYSVCELCKVHALHEGWMREGAIPDYTDAGVSADRRRSLFGRRRASKLRLARREAQPVARSGQTTLDDELSLGDRPRHAPPVSPPGTSPSRQNGARDYLREPRHVHAIPASGDQKIAAAVDAFNQTEYRRTVAGVARSLGMPGVNVTPDGTHPALVWIAVTWELCWYRYEVDLSDERTSVRLSAQGYELAELAEYELAVNATADESGAVVLI